MKDGPWFLGEHIAVLGKALAVVIVVCVVVFTIAAVSWMICKGGAP